MNIKIICSVTCLSLSLLGCITPPTPESEQIQVIWDNVAAIQHCQLKGVVYGTEGAFYDFWLLSDKKMLWGALNQMKIDAVAKGGDVIYLYHPMEFSTSITMMGNVYLCDKPIATSAPTNIASKVQAK